MAQSLSKIISNVDSFEKLIALETNIRKMDALTEEVEREIKEKYAELGRTLVSERTDLLLEELTEAEEKIVQAVALYVGLQKRDGKTANRTFGMLSRRGLIESAEVSVCKSKPTQGYEVLEDADGVDGSCTIGVKVRHTAVVTNCLRGATPCKLQQSALIWPRTFFKSTALERMEMLRSTAL